MIFKEISVNDYFNEFQVKGDIVSNILGAKAAETWNHEAVTVMREGNSVIPTIKIPKGYVGIVQTQTGPSDIRNPVEYSKALMHNLISAAKKVGAKPWAFSCDVDSNDTYPELCREIGSNIVDSAKRENFAYMNGEYAILPGRVSNDVKLNIVGMMLSIIPESQAQNLVGFDIIKDDGSLYMNSDGVGTKPEFSEIKGIVGQIVQDANEMKAGDAARVGSRILVMHDAYELSGLPKGVNIHDYLKNAFKIADKLGKDGRYTYRLIPENVGNRIQSIHPDLIAQNCSGNVIGRLEPELYKQLNSFEAGHFLIAFKGLIDNPRSNGISAWRAFVHQYFGDDYRKDSKNKELEAWLDYLTAPSTPTYSAIMELAEKGLATFFTHQSGGAMQSKLLSKLAKKGIGAELADMYEPYYLQKKVIEEGGYGVEQAYKIWPMGIDGFVATRDPRNTIRVMAKHNLEGRIVSVLEKMDNPSIMFRAYNGEFIQYYVK